MSLLNNYTLANGDTAYYALAGSGIPIPGPPGPQGAQGVQGPPGISILSDVLPPTAGVGVVDDLYVDLATAQLYKKTDPATWTPEFSMVGPEGLPGTPATVSVGLTTTLPPGSAANVNNSGTLQNAVFNFAIPQGLQGPQGAQGPPGSPATAAIWSEYPATQAVDMNNQPIINAASIGAPIGLAVNANAGNIELNVAKNTGATIKIAGGDLDLSGQAVINTTGMSGAALSLATTAGNITLTPLAPADPKVSIMGGDLDLNGGDLKELGSLSTSGAGNSAVFGGYVPPAAPLALFQAIASDVSITHINPLTQFNLTSVKDMRIEATGGDLNLIGNDINLGATGSTDILNITAVAGIQNTAGGFFNVSAGGGMGIQAGGLISITTPGQINIGSGNVLGATTSIEKLDILDTVVSKVAGAADLEYRNVKKISNAGDATNTLTVEATNGFLTVQGTQTNITSLSNGNVVIAPQGTGIIKFATLGDANAAAIDASGSMLFNSAPKCASAPITSIDLARKGYVDTKLPGNADVSLTNNFGSPAAAPASAGPYLQVAGAAGTPTGVPTVIPGCVPLYVDTTGGGKLYAFFSGVWNAI